MPNFIEALVTLLEFVALGGLATLLLAYIVIWINPVWGWLTQYTGDAKKFLFEGAALFQHAPEWLWSGTVAVLGVGYLYFAGSVANTTAYWLVQPAHDAGVASYYLSVPTNPTKLQSDSLSSIKQSDCAGKIEETNISPWAWVFLKRIAWARENDKCEKALRRLAMSDAASWRTLARESADTYIDPIEKHLRLARGLALCALGLAFVALFKFSGAGLVIWVTPRNLPLAQKLYAWLIEPPDPKVVSKPDEAQILNTTRPRRNAYAVHLFLCFVIYLVCIQGYMNGEREFHSFTYFGARAAIDKEEQELKKPACCPEVRSQKEQP